MRLMSLKHLIHYFLDRWPSENGPAWGDLNVFVTSPPLGEMSESARRNPRTQEATWIYPEGFFTFSGLLGYRALYVNYEQGKGGCATSLICCSTGQLLDEDAVLATKRAHCS